MQDLNYFDPYATGALIVLAALAGFIRGFTGFGGPAVMVLALIPFFNPLSVLPKVAVIDTVANFKLLPSALKEANFRLVCLMSLASFVGIPVGMYVLNSVDPLVMKRLIAAVALVCTIAMFRGWRFEAIPSPYMYCLVGFFAGMVLGATLIAFVMMMFLFAIPTSAAVSRAHAICWGFAAMLVILPMYAYNGVLNFVDTGISLAIGVIYLATAVLGAAVFRRTAERNFRNAVMWLLAALAVAGLIV